MPMIRIPYPLRPYVHGQAEVTVQGSTAAEAMENLVTGFPAFRPHLYKEDGSLRAFVNLFLEGKNIKDLKGMNTPLSPDDILNLVPSIAGG
jgi:molybdopterin converting factor small subunit